MVVGDICMARKQGRHRVIPFHSHVIQLCLDAGALLSVHPLHFHVPLGSKQLGLRM
jgi:hypothetical protein